MWENVANVLSAKHKHNFDKYLSVLEDLGYCSTYVVLNGKDFGVAQNRVRLICISILKNSEFDVEILNDLAEKIKILCSDEKLRKEYGNNNRKLAEEKFNRSKTYEKIVELVED